MKRPKPKPLPIPHFVQFGTAREMMNEIAELRKQVKKVATTVKKAYLDGYQDGTRDYFGVDPEDKAMAEYLWLSSEFYKELLEQKAIETKETK